MISTIAQLDEAIALVRVNAPDGRIEVGHEYDANGNPSLMLYREAIWGVVDYFDDSNSTSAFWLLSTRTLNRLIGERMIALGFS
jgi:hypothetical protein